MKRAFTLIELLVVIAIIAILAAILFPVFAQAKAAAKATASLSNTKQLALGCMMYSGDADDQAPLAAAYGNSDAPINYGGIGKYSPWSWLTTPYIKSGQIFLDPLKGDQAGWTASSGVSSSVWSEAYPQFGLNAALLNNQANNATGATPSLVWASNSMTSIDRVADMVMLAETSSRSDSGWGHYSYSGITTHAVIEAPYCYNGCSDLWGGRWYKGAGYGGVADTSAGGDTGGVAFRRNGLKSGSTAAVAFCDGHAKAMSPGALAIGTDWNVNSSNVNLTGDYKSTYRWFQY